MYKTLHRKLLTAAVGAAVGVLALPAHAEFALGEETKGINVKFNDEADMNIRVRLQPRLDLGEIGQNATTRQFYSETDLYLRRIRLETEGSLVKGLKYNLTLSADREDQNYRARTSTNSATASTADDQKFGVHYAYLDYKFANPLSVRFGQFKLPLSRISLSSSARQLVVERPFSTEDAKGLFGDYEQVELMLHGSVAGGIFKYMLAAADGSDQNRAGTAYANTDAELAYIGRLEFSPPGMTEKGQSDAHLGKGQHLTFGLNAGSQGSVKSNGGAIETNRELMGVDISFHIGGFTAQAEYNAWKVGETGILLDLEPKGWYVQAGYFIPGVNIEPVVRFEEYDLNSNATTDQTNKYTTVGLNWYAKGHSMKIGVNWQKSKFGAGNLGTPAQQNERDVYQVQTQIYF